MSSLLSVSALRLTASSSAPFKSTVSCSKFHIQASWKAAVPFNYSFLSRNLRNSTSRLGGFRVRDLIFDPNQDPLFKEVILKQYPEDEDEEDLEEDPETSEEALEILHKLLPKDREGLEEKPEMPEALEMLPKFLPGKGLKMQEEKPKKPEEGLKTDEWEVGIPEEELEMGKGGLGERDYRDRIVSYSKHAKLPDVVQTGVGKIGDIPVAIGVMDFKFMGGSMGSVVGEKITRLVEYATLKSLPLILVCASGGARMQEGSLSLMQMAKISSALSTYQSKNRLFIPILTTPTTGGVTASFAMLGDVIIAEPNALIAFAGKRVIEETLKLEVPEGSQSAEVLSEKGLLDLIIPREDLETVIYALFEFHQFHRKEKENSTNNQENQVDN